MRPNLCQVHLADLGLYDDLARDGWPIEPGQLGENVTTRGIDLMSLPGGSILHLGTCASIRITGKRRPCDQIDGFQPRLMKAVLCVHESGKRESRAGIMGVVLTGEIVRSNDAIRVELPRGRSVRWSRSDRALRSSTSSHTEGGPTEH